MYTLAAEQGVEMAQSNAAWILDHGLGVGGELVKNNEDRDRLALHYFTMSAQQNNADSLLKLADYSYYGRGTDVDYEGSAAYYMQASEMRNPQAYFNLGFMHQFGLGLPQDFHLARRFYDLTMQVTRPPAVRDAASALAPAHIPSHTNPHSSLHDIVSSIAGQRLERQPSPSRAGVGRCVLPRHCACNRTAQVQHLLYAQSILAASQFRRNTGQTLNGNTWWVAGCAAGLEISIWWARVKGSMPSFVVQAVDSVVELVGIGLPPPVPPPSPPKTSAGGVGGAGGASGDSAAGQAGSGGEAEVGAASGEGLWQSWSTFVADTVGMWDWYTEKLRLALDPTTLKATFGFGAGSGGALPGADSDTVLIAVLAVMLAMVWMRRRRAIAMMQGVPQRMAVME